MTRSRKPTLCSIHNLIPDYSIPVSDDGTRFLRVDSVLCVLELDLLASGVFQIKFIIITYL